MQPGVPQAPLAGALGEALSLIPKPLPAGAKFTATGGAQQFVLTLNDGRRKTNAEFYPYPSEVAANESQPPDAIINAAEQKIEPQRDGVRLTVQRSPDLAILPAMLHGVFKLSDTEAYDVSAPVVPGEVAALQAAAPHQARRRLARLAWHFSAAFCST